MTQKPVAQILKHTLQRV